MKKYQGTLHPKSGLTLVEVLVATIIFAVIMLFGMSFFTFSSTSFGHSQNTTFAIALANSEMERLKVISWVDLDPLVLVPTRTESDDQGVVYTVTRSVVNLPLGVTPPTHRQITVSVTWPGGKSDIDLVSIRAQG